MQTVVGKNMLLPFEEHATSPIDLRKIENPGIQSIAPSMVPFRLNKILVPIGFSAASEKVLPYAVALAQQFGSTIELLSVAPCYSFIPSFRFLRISRSTEQCLDQAAKVLIQLARSEVPPGTRGGTTIRVGEPAREITAAARELGADLIVMTIHGRARHKHRLRAGVAERVVRAQPCLVLSVPEELLQKGQRQPVPACRNVLVPVDLTEFSRMTLNWASNLAGRMGAKVTLRYAPAMLAKKRSPRTMHQNRRQIPVPKAIELQLAEWGNSGASAPVEVDLLPEMATPNAATLAQMVGRAASDLMLIGSRRCSWWQRLAHQGVAERLLRLVPCPVLSVPERVVTTLATADEPN